MRYEEAVAPFEFGEGSKYVLAIHGFTGMTYKIRDLALYLAAQGFHVIGPQLPGHGQNKEALAETRWQDWWNEVKQTIETIRAKKPSHFFVTGLSMGGALTLYSAAQYPEITAIAPICAPVFIKDNMSKLIPLIKLFKTYFPKKEEFGEQDPNLANNPILIENNKRYNQHVLPAVASLLSMLKNIRKYQLSKIRQPILIAQALKDKTVHPSSAKYIFEHISTKPEEKSILWLENSGHVATMDYDKEQLFSEIGNLFKKYSE
ncbi:MAG: alpha/beta hydrolase [Candidatus Hermodarchaeota archaeon]